MGPVGGTKLTQPHLFDINAQTCFEEEVFMEWFRGGTAMLNVKSMTDIYGQSHNLPRCVAIETSNKAIANDAKNPAVNVVLYNDTELHDERNDFFFTSLEEALGFCAETYNIAEGDWLNLGKWQEVTK